MLTFFKLDFEKMYGNTATPYWETPRHFCAVLPTLTLLTPCFASAYCSGLILLMRLVREGG